MATQHPHHEIILAYLNGEVVQCFIENTWVDCNPWSTERNTALPGFSPNIQYRIKPKLKKYKVALFRGVDNKAYPQLFWENGWSEAEKRSSFVRWLTDVLEHEETV